ncbi:hypothetical protein DPMN_031433 [Dreissena polymorpha]|uniref:Chitin synthase n=1 Tax=Dreissena polymorpha TaxID=45954 RepID=A0A9D4RJB7_DREPO|nr:hypothetical protein DPMN_031433 [Dreissena polymorpha]
MASNEVSGTSTSSNSKPMSSEINKASKQETFVIETDSKIKRELKRKDNKHSFRPSYGVVVLKWLSTFLLCLLILAFVIFSKVGIVSISQQMSRELVEDAAAVKRTQGVFVSLQIATVVPHVFSFLRGILMGAFRKDIPWPTRRSLILGVVLSIVESVGTTLFVFCLPGLTGPGTTVLLMSGVFLAPILYNVVHSWMVPPKSAVPPESTNLKWITRILFIVALLLELAGLASAGYTYHNHKTDPGMDANDAKRFGFLVTALLCLSISWIPGIQSFLLKTTNDAVVTSQASNKEPTHAKETKDNNAQPGSGSVPNSNPSRERKHTSNAPEAQTTAVGTSSLPPPTWKLTIVMSAVKTVCIFGCSILFYAEVFPGRPVKDWVDGWGHLGSQLTTTDWVMFAGNIGGSLFGYFTAYIACTTCMQWFGITILLNLSITPLSYVAFYVMCTKDVLGESTCKMYYNPYSLIALVLLVAAQTISTGCLFFRSQFLVMLKEDKLFWTPMYTSGLLEQWLMLSKKTEYHDEHHEDPLLKASRTKVIICTTMYREADYEMRQLLQSISGINRAQTDGTRHFESHIFFDGAVKKVNPTDSVLQLVSLAEEELGVKSANCKRKGTPYGMSIEWELINNKGHRLLLRIHLKDNQKVKNKKRWSQVMYMSYVLDFFLKQENNCRHDECFILTTDADVCFNVDSVEALLDLMTRDPSVGRYARALIP